MFLRDSSACILKRKKSKTWKLGESMIQNVLKKEIVMYQILIICFETAEPLFSLKLNAMILSGRGRSDLQSFMQLEKRF